jgi:hemoglobin-like flavoprotein
MNVALSDRQIRLVKGSLPKIHDRLEPASMAFYENLFSIAPDMRPMFREDLAGQGMKFLTTMNTIAELLDDPEALESELRDLGEGHASFGVRGEHFAPMGAALMVTLGETLGADFTDELQAAWRAAYEEIARRMAGPANAG